MRDRSSTWFNVSGELHVEEMSCPMDMPLLAGWLKNRGYNPDDFFFAIVIEFLSDGHYHPMVYGREWGDCEPADYCDERRDERVAIQYDDGENCKEIVLCPVDDIQLINEIWNHYEEEIYNVELED